LPATSITRSYDSLLSSTLQKIRPKFTDQIFVGVPLWDWLNKSGQKEPVSGGTHIMEPVTYKANTTPRSFSGYDTIDLTPQDTDTVAQFEAREYDASVVISRRQKEMNSGPEQLINLLKSKTDNARNALIDQFNAHAFAAQSGTNLDGLGTLVSNSATTVGSISESTNSWWAPQRDTSALTAATFKDALLNIFNDCSRVKRGFPNLILTTQAVWEMYHGLVEDQGEFVLADDNPAAGFGRKALSFMGEPMVWDADCPSAHVYLLNSQTIKLRVYSGADFDLGPTKEPVDQHAFARAFYWMGNLTILERRANGVMTNVS
jgi:hypothetical protein